MSTSSPFLELTRDQHERVKCRLSTWNETFVLQNPRETSPSLLGVQEHLAPLRS
jgi:hypothetical protein